MQRISLKKQQSRDEYLRESFGKKDIYEMAKELGISPSTVWYALKKIGLGKKDKKQKQSSIVRLPGNYSNHSPMRIANPGINQ